MAELYDVIVVGGGPAGLTAALYLARARYRVLVVEREQFGGQIAITEEVVNYPGVEKTSGRALTDTMRRQAEAFGAEFLLAEVQRLSLAEKVKTVHTGSGDYRCLGLLLATGARPRAVGFRGEAEYRGRGVAYCATCDGEFFTGCEVFVIGGGYAAAEESVFLTKFASKVTILMRGADFSCAAAVAEAAKAHEKIHILPHTVVEEVSGETGLNYIRYRNTETNVVTEYRAPEGAYFGVFVLAGYTPDTALVQGVVELDAQGCLVTDAAQRTGIEGVYAAGDVCAKTLRQVVTATGDGALAATELERYVAAVQRETGLHASAPVARSAPPAEAGTQLTPQMRQELRTLLDRMKEPLLLELSLDTRPVSAELEQLLRELTALSDKLRLHIATREAGDEETPCVSVCRADGSPTGLRFHGVPGGHEFTSFVLGLYYASGAAAPMDEARRAALPALRTPARLRVLVTLSCQICPELVLAAQQLVLSCPGLSLDVYDLRHFPALKERYRVMSVPCLVIDDARVVFGKKSVEQLAGLLAE